MAQDYDKKLFRLIYLLGQLDKSSAVYVRKMAEEFNTTVRTVQRDILRLGAAGFPVMPGENKGTYRFAPGFSLKKVSLTDEEAILLTLLSETAASLGPKFESSFKTLFTKLLTHERTESPYHAIMPARVAQQEECRFISVLEKAINDRCKVEIGFNRLSTNKVILYSGCPLKIVFWDGFWYLMLLHDAKKDIWKLRLDNIKSVRVLNQKFDFKADLKTLLAQCTNVWFAQKRSITARLKVSPVGARTLLRKKIFPEQKTVKTLRDGSLIIETKLCRFMEAIPDILYWMPHIEVLRPQKLRLELLSTVHKYLVAMGKNNNIGVQEAALGGDL